MRARLRRGSEAEARIARGLGEPALFAILLSAVGSSIYFSLGVVAGDAMGLTPVVFVVAGLFFVITMLTYVEGNSLHPERGGAATFARYAFNELWSFIAGWAILLDYLIVMAIAAFALSHYLAAFWGVAGQAGAEIVIAGGAIAYVAWANFRGISAERYRFVLVLSLLSIGVFIAVIATGAAQFFDLSLVTDSVDVGDTPPVDDLLFAAVVATVACTGIEAASGLAGDIRVGRRGLRRVVWVSALAVIGLFAGMSLIALMALPVGADGSTALAGPFIDAPVLGVVNEFDPPWLAEAFRYLVGAVAALVLLQAMNGQMLGIGRLAYSLGTNRQIPSIISRLHDRWSTPYVAIGLAAAIAFVLTLPDIEFLAGIFAFGAMIAFTLAHLSVIVLRFREPDRPSAFRVPGSIRVGGGSIPGALGPRGADGGERVGHGDRAPRGRAGRWRALDGVRHRAVRDLPARPGQVAHEALHDPGGGASGDQGGGVRQHPRARLRGAAGRRHRRDRRAAGLRGGRGGRGRRGARGAVRVRGADVPAHRRARVR